MAEAPETHDSSTDVTDTPEKKNTNIDDLMETGANQEEPSAKALIADDSPDNNIASNDEAILNGDKSIANNAPIESKSVAQDDENSEESAPQNKVEGSHNGSSDEIEIEDVKESGNMADIPEASTDVVNIPEASADPVNIPEASADQANTPQTSTATLEKPTAHEIKVKARRKTIGVPEHRAKKISKKIVKPKTTHIDAKPGDYFYVRLKGYPLWPAIVCDETMLPSTLLKSRPVTAARPDGTYREEFMNGGPKAKDRSFPVMYLSTNEFGWIPNYDLLEIDFEEVGKITGTMRKDLVLARQLAAKKHGLDYFKDILKSFMETKEAERLELEKATEEKRSQKEKKKEKENEKKKTPRKPRKSKATVDDDENADVDMPDAVVEKASVEIGPLNPSTKRSAEEPLEGHPKKKTTIKLTTKSNIGKLPPKSPKAPKAPAQKKQKAEKIEKASKSKKQKASATPSVQVPIEPELSSEELRVKKEKEILFLRHKLQKGLLNKDQELKPDEMQNMSDFFDKLEAYTDLEVSIIRQTKINKVLKAILKITSIPRDEEFQFKHRSHNLLEKWNRILADDSGKLLGSIPTNGANSEDKVNSKELDSAKKQASEGNVEEKRNINGEISTRGKTRKNSKHGNPKEISEIVDDHPSTNEDLKVTAQDSDN